MSLRGQRFEVNLSDDEEGVDAGEAAPQNIPALISSAFIGDIMERPTAPASAPKMKNTPTGFPEHKKRTKISAFKQQRARSAKPPSADSVNAFALPKPQLGQPTNPTRLTQDATSIDKDEKQRIDEDNNRLLASMSDEQIEQERAELLASLDPALVERLLRRANLDDGRGDTGIDPPQEKQPDNNEKPNEKSNEEIGVPTPTPSAKRVQASKSVTFADDDEPAEPLGPQSTATPVTGITDPMAPSIHFPAAPSAPDLDPSDPSFLESLHSKYFPNLPADPSKLAWMAPVPTHGSIADQESPYYPASSGLSASALRFDFRGGLLPPRIARAVPVSKGLHHHGEAPEAAGYTVPELARLARSSFPSQRCIAFQTLGRLLYRLGRGEWGDADNEITQGLWKCIEDGKVIQTIQEAASAEGGHQGSKVYAVEAVWLWQKGGGKIWKAT